MGIEEGILSQWHLLFMRGFGLSFDLSGEGVNQNSLQIISSILVLREEMRVGISLQLGPLRRLREAGRTRVSG